jgi:hypothetical protein
LKHTGLLAAIIGAAGGFGSNNVTSLGNVNGQLTPVNALVTVIAE